MLPTERREGIGRKFMPCPGRPIAIPNNPPPTVRHNHILKSRRFLTRGRPFQNRMKG